MAFFAPSRETNIGSLHVPNRSPLSCSSYFHVHAHFIRAYLKASIQRIASVLGRDAFAWRPCGLRCAILKRRCERPGHSNASGEWDENEMP
jgi:hypothetical protein